MARRDAPCDLVPDPLAARPEAERDRPDIAILRHIESRSRPRRARDGALRCLSGREGNSLLAPASGADPERASELVVRGKVELLTFRFSGEILPSRAVAGRRPISHLTCTIVAGRRLASLGVCLRWHPLWLPVRLPSDSLNRQAESHQRRVIGAMGSYITVAQQRVPSGGSIATSRAPDLAHSGRLEPRPQPSSAAARYSLRQLSAN
jgi:hypothetical protein